MTHLEASHRTWRILSVKRTNKVVHGNRLTGFGDDSVFFLETVLSELSGVSKEEFEVFKEFEELGELEEFEGIPSVSGGGSFGVTLFGVEFVEFAEKIFLFCRGE